MNLICSKWNQEVRTEPRTKCSSRSFIPYQCVEVISDESAIVDDVPLEDDEKEEKSQHHVTKVTEDVVECAVKRKLSISQRKTPKPRRS